jgi:glycerophosphoryl diester phosphodiesterase
MTARRPLILAHRGAHTVHRENSLEAFSAAFDAEADGIECDVQKSPRGDYVIVHDPPATTKNGFKSERPGPVSLEAMLESLPFGAFLNLELKSDTLTAADCGPIFEALGRRPASGGLLISSFEPALLPYFKARGVQIGLLIGEEAAKTGMARMARQIFRLKPDYLNMPILMFEVLGTRRGLLLASLSRALGFSLAFWTVNREEELRLVKKLARIIITDDVHTVRTALHLRPGER